MYKPEKRYLVQMRNLGPALWLLSIAVLFTLAGALALLGWLAVDNLWADYKDGSNATYVTVAAVEFVTSALLVALGIWLLRTR
jgi:hypothetical protein